MFDFVHRDPLSYGLHVSLLPTQQGVGGIQFVRPYNARSIFDMAADKGYPSTSLWWPATFPARPELPVNTLPGLGTPDIQGRLGIGCLYTTNGEIPEKMGKTPVKQLRKAAVDHYTSALDGPMLKDGEYAQLPFEVRVLNEHSAELRIEKQIIPLKLGQWSPTLEVRFKLGFLVSVHALAQAGGHAAQTACAVLCDAAANPPAAPAVALWNAGILCQGCLEKQRPIPDPGLAARHHWSGRWLYQQ